MSTLLDLVARQSVGDLLHQSVQFMQRLLLNPVHFGPLFLVLIGRQSAIRLFLLPLVVNIQYGDAIAVGVAGPLPSNDIRSDVGPKGVTEDVLERHAGSHDNSVSQNPKNVTQQNHLRDSYVEREKRHYSAEVGQLAIVRLEGVVFVRQGPDLLQDQDGVRQIGDIGRIEGEGKKCARIADVEDLGAENDIGERSS